MLSILHLILALGKMFQMLGRFKNYICAPVMTEVDLIGHKFLLAFPFASSGLYLSSYSAIFALRSGEKMSNFLVGTSVSAKKGCGTLRQGQSRIVLASSLDWFRLC